MKKFIATIFAMLTAPVVGIFLFHFVKGVKTALREEGDTSIRNERLLELLNS